MVGTQYRKKIGIGFTLVLVLLLVFGVWNFIGLFSLRDQNEFVLKTSNLIYDFGQRKSITCFGYLD